MYEEMQLYDREGRRLYLTEEELRAFVEASRTAPGPLRTLCYLHAYTGCRASEAISMSASRIDLVEGTVSFAMPARQKAGSLREVPLPGHVIEDLDRVHGIAGIKAAADERLWARLWPWTQDGARNKIRRVMEIAGIPPGPHACPNGIRHGFALYALGNGIEPAVVQRWLGYAKKASMRRYDMEWMTARDALRLLDTRESELP